MGKITFRPIDLLILPFYQGYMEELAFADIRSIAPQAMSVYEDLKDIQKKAAFLGCADFDSEVVRQIDAHREAMEESF